MKKNEKRQGGEQIEFECGDVIMILDGEAQMSALTKPEITEYELRVICDHELPEGAIRATIDQLGLKNYMFKFGLCDDSQGGNNG